MMRDKKQLGELLVEEGRLSRSSLDKALETQRLVGGRLGTNLLELGLVSAEDILSALSRQRATRAFAEADLARISPQVLASIPSKLAQRYRVLPVELKGRTLSIASLDPGDPLQEDEISFMTSFMVRTCIALEAHLSLALQRYYKVPCDQRFLVLRRRQQRMATARTRPPSNLEPSAPPADTTSAAANQAAVPKPSEGPISASAEEPSETAAARTSKPSRTPEKKSAKPALPAPEVEFIELDDDDAALLRRADSGEQSPVDLAVDGPSLAVEQELAAQAQDSDQAAQHPQSLVDPSPDAGLLATEPLVAPDDTELILPPPQVPDLPMPVLVTNMETTHFEDTGTWDQALAQSLGTPEGRLAQAAKELQDADIRDEIGDVLLSFASVYFRRRMLFIARKERIVGWMGEGEGVDTDRMRAIDLDARLPSIFSNLRQADSFWRGPLPALPLNHQLISAVGGEMPKECVALPVTLRSKVVCYFYGDNLDLGVSGIPMAELKRLVVKAGIAFEVYILKNKIRML